MITVTPTAVHEIKQLIGEQQENLEEPLALRVYVSGGGCSGFSYGMALVTEKRDDDEELDADGVRILIDPASKRFLEGARVEYRQGLGGGGFAIENPNAVATCGCGQSFKAKEHQGAPEPC